MNITEIPVDNINAPDWNSNRLDQGMALKLSESIARYGLVVPLVVRAIRNDHYETVGGAQRLAVMTDLGYDEVPCVVIDANDTEAMLLAQALNNIAGSDDLGLKAELLRKVLVDYGQDEVLALLPETSESLQSLVTLGEGDLSQQLQAWQQAQAARLKHMTIQLHPSQLETVEEALERVMTGVTKNEENPNKRGNALFALCQQYLEIQKETS